MAEAEQLAVEWMMWNRDVAQRSERTTGTYADVLLRWIAFCDKNKIDPLDPMTQDLEAFMTRKRSNGRKGKPSTQRLDVAVLKTWYTWLCQRGKLPANPSLDLIAPKMPGREPRPIVEADWQTLWGSDLPPRLRVMLGFGYYCGLRRAEIHELCTEQITPSRIVHFVRKGGGEDTLPWLDMAEIVSESLPHLLPEVGQFSFAVHHVKSRYERVSPWLNINQFYKRMTDLCEKASIPHYHPHQLRHSAATNLCAAGVPIHLVKELMNHSSIDITMMYVKAGARELRQWRANQ